MESGTVCRQLHARAMKVMPRGVTSNFRDWGFDKTLVVKKAKGAYLWDQDDNRYLDYRLGFGPVILGHANDTVLERVREALEMGNIFAMTHMYEISVAEKITSMTGMDMLRYANSGTEAAMHSIRIARASTGRDKVLKFEGCYHGFQDNTLWSCYPPVPGCGSRKSPLLVAHGSGVPQLMSQLVLVVPYNDEELLEKKVREHWGEIACIIVEPLLGNTASIMPKKGFLQTIRKLCDEYGIVMIMDEVKTGFRVAKGGAQEYFGVKADMVTYAKALANGFPLAVIAGRKEIMDEVGPSIPHGGTYNGNVVSTAAANATLDEIAAGALVKINRHGEKLMRGIRSILADRGVPGVVHGPPSMFGVVLSDKEEITDYRDWAESDHLTYASVIQKMFEKGVMPDFDTREPWFISSAHTDADADIALQAFDEALQEVTGKR